MSERAESFRSRIGSAWSGYLPLWGIAITIWCVNSTVLLGFALTADQFFSALLANVCAATALILLGLLWRNHVHHRQIPIPAWRVFAAGSVVGLVKGSVTFVVFGLLTAIPISIAGLIQSSLPALLIGMWLLPAFGIVGSLREEFAQERAVLIRKMVTRDINASPSRYLSEDIAGFVERAKALVTSKKHSVDSLKNALNDLAEKDVRPLSHRLWQHEESQIGTFQFRDLVSTTLRLHHFPALWTSLSLLVSLLFLQIPLVGLSGAFQRSVVQTGIALILLVLGRHVPLRGRMSGTLVFFMVPAFIVVVIEAVTVALFGTLPGVDSRSADIALFIALTMTLLVLGTVFTAKETHEVVKQRLSSLREADLEADANKILQLMRRRETAELMHGYVQNQLLAGALLLAAEPHSLQTVASRLDVMLNDLEQGEVPGHRISISSIKELKRALEQTWRGVMTVSVVTEKASSLSEEELSILERLCQECASNSRRHGHASELTIELQVTPEHLVLRVDDNGSGLQGGVPALGTALIHTLSAGQWTRHTQASGTGTTVLCTIPRMKDSIL